ncbi:hypothetical protein [Herbaspirillum huttiense]|uniref:hypothetical protein n=1 Tax=Herbaspirillum huttiense TaxID=863372 RepID=UPI003B3A3198
MITTPIAWPEAQRICDIPEVREALDKFAADAQEENMLAMVSAIMGHAVTQGRAAGLEEAVKVLTKRIQSSYQVHQHTDGETGERYFNNDYADLMEAAYHAELGALAEVIKLKATASPTTSDAGKDDALELDAKRWRMCLDLAHGHSGADFDGLCIQLPYPTTRRIYRSTADQFEAAIDAAIAAQGAGE